MLFKTKIMLSFRLKTLAIGFVGSILLVVILYFVSGWMSLHPHGFLRKLPSHEMVGTGLVRLSDRSGYLAGADDSDFYVGNWSKRSQLLAVKSRSKQTAHIKISGFDTVKFTRGGYLRTDSSDLYLFDGNKPAILSGNAGNGKLLQMYRPPYFTAAVPLAPNAYILKVVESGQRNAIIKFSANKLSKPYLLEEQGDGIFSTDGMLLKSPHSARLFYIYYYRNQFLCLDTNLNLLYKGKTIDTVSHAHIKVKPVKSMHEFTLASPPLFVNEQCAASDKYLFIHSALRADNEISSAMDQVSAIDVYRISDGKYVFSFYIDDFEKEKMQDFRVAGNTLVALFKDYLYKYQLKF